MRDEFQVHQLNAVGMAKAQTLGEIFSRALEDIEAIVPAGRERSLVITKLQETSFFAKRAIAAHPFNQEGPRDDGNGPPPYPPPDTAAQGIFPPGAK